MNELKFEEFSKNYIEKLKKTLNEINTKELEKIIELITDCWINKKQVFIFGNGGSAGNAIHLANDFIYGISKEIGTALKINALSANPAVITCLANDEGYDEIFRRQLAVLSNPGDLAIALSGSGNSSNIINALEWCNENDICTVSILGFDGGKAKNMSKYTLHCNINDMQISEDMQLIFYHIIMQWLGRKY